MSLSATFDASKLFKSKTERIKNISISDQLGNIKDQRNANQS